MTKPPWSWDKFDRRYAAQSLRARERLHRRRQRSAEQADQRAARRAKLSPFLRGWIESLSIQAQARRLAAHERLLHGFRWPGGMVNGRNFAPFVAHRLRSGLHPILRLFVSRLRRTGTLLSGDRKSMSPHMQGQPKLVQLDQPYVAFNTVMQGVIRLDLDHDFASWEELQTALLEAGLPPPNFCVAHVEEDGRVHHPHAYYLLATAVCHGRNGRSKPRHLLRAISSAPCDKAWSRHSMASALIPAASAIHTRARTR